MSEAADCKFFELQITDPKQAYYIEHSVRTDSELYLSSLNGDEVLVGKFYDECDMQMYGLFRFNERLKTVYSICNVRPDSGSFRTLHYGNNIPISVFEPHLYIEHRYSNFISQNGCTYYRTLFGSKETIMLDGGFHGILIEECENDWLWATAKREPTKLSQEEIYNMIFDQPLDIVGGKLVFL